MALTPRWPSGQAWVRETFSEIRALPDVARIEHLKTRREVQQLVTDRVENGVQQKMFATSYPHHAARVLTNICVGVSRWYRANGALSVDELVVIYTERD